MNLPEGITNVPKCELCKAEPSGHYGWCPTLNRGVDMRLKLVNKDNLKGVYGDPDTLIYEEPMEVCPV